MMIHLCPIWRRANGGLARRPADERMVDRPQIQRDHERRQARGKRDLHQSRLGVAVRRGGFVVEEALQEMPHQQRKLAALRLAHRPHRRLHVQ